MSRRTPARGRARGAPSGPRRPSGAPPPGGGCTRRSGWEGVRTGAAALGGSLRLEREDGERTLSLAISRTPRRDSFRAIAGGERSGLRVGAASDDAVEGRAAWATEAGRLELSARAGQVTGSAMTPTLLAAAGARLDRRLARSGGWTLSAGGAAEATHHARDLAGLDGDPAAPRLFSPPLYVGGLAPAHARRGRPGRRGSRSTRDPRCSSSRGRGGALRAGGDVRASLVQPLGGRLRLTAEVRAERIAAVYSRVEGGAALAVVFP